MRLFFRSAIVFILLLLIIPAQANNNNIPQFASTGGYRVTTTTDGNDGMCNSHCTLREAIIAANNDTGLNPIVYIPNGTYTLTLTGAGEDSAATGDLDIRHPMSIIGEERDTTIIDANDLDRAFDVHGANLTAQDEGQFSENWDDTQFILSDVTIQNGYVTGADGGGIRIASAAPSIPIITLMDVIIQNSLADNGGGLTVQDAHFQSRGLRLLDNIATNKGGGLYHNVLASNDITTIDSDIMVDGNSAQLGGGIYYDSNSQPGNSANNDNYYLDGAVVNNSAVNGGGIYVYKGTQVTFSGTISGNTAKGNGGGLYNNINRIPMYAATVTNNTADSDNNGSGNGGGIYYENIPTFPVYRSSGLIFYGNHDTGGQAPECGSNATVTFYAQDSILGIPSPCSGNGSNLLSQDPLLLPLANNGGDTLTHALQATSPAIGMLTQCYSDEDQRGVVRKLASTNCEPGAYAYANGIPYNQIPPQATATYTTRGYEGFPVRYQYQYADWTQSGYIGVTYPDDMLDISNSTTNPAEIDNVQNYRLLTPGDDDNFQTDSCAAVQGDDQSSSFTLSYDRGLGYPYYMPSVLLIPTNGGMLYAGQYRLIVCDSITDEDGNALDGDSDLVAGGDYILDFSLADTPEQVLQVNTTADTTDGVCDTSHCSLRDAVRVANAFTGITEIHLPAGLYTLNITGADEDAALTGDLDLFKNTIIVGAGADATIIDANGIDRIFDVYNKFKVDSLTLRDGGNAITNSGGAIRVFNNNLVEVFRSVLENNTAGVGGAIAAQYLHVFSSTFSNNTAAIGGAIYSNGSGSSPTGTIEVNESAFISNHADNRGSAISIANGHLNNSTFSGNTGDGGVIFFANSMRFTQNTITDNGSGILTGNTYHYSPDFQGISNIISNNVSVNCGLHPDFGNPSIAFEGKFNIVDDNSCAFGARNLYNTDPLLLPLSDNGGLTLTHALSSTSPALNVLLLDACQRYIDQHIVDREEDGVCDIGAFEGVATALNPPTNLAITGTTDTSVSLSWTDTSDEAGYRIERSNDGVTNWAEIVTTTANVNTYTDNSVACNTTYHYRALATDGINFSDYSNIATDTTLICELDAPTNLVVTGSTQDGVTLQFQPNDVSATNYVLERSADNGVSWQVAHWVLSGTATTTDDSRIACGTTYHYRVRSYRIADNTYSPYSNIAQGTTTTCPSSLIPLVYIVTTTENSNDGNCTLDDCTLREAFVAAQGRDVSQIRIPAGIYSVTNLNEFVITRDNIDIQGAGADQTIIDFQNQYAGISVDTGASAVIRAVTVRESNQSNVAVATNATVTLENSVITGAAAGGIVAENGFVTLIRSVVSGNKNTISGAGIRAINSYLFLQHTTVSENILQGNGYGAGIYFEMPPLASAYSELHIEHSIIDTNQGGDGGTGLTIFSETSTAFYELVLYQVIVSGHINPNAEGIRVDTVSSPTFYGITLTNNTIGLQTMTGSQPVDARHSLLTGNETDIMGIAPITQQNTLVGGDARLGSLRYNGGIMSSHALLPGSPAIDAMINNDPFDCLYIGSDIRGVPRPFGSLCDVGAFEVTDRLVTVNAPSNLTITESVSQGFALQWADNANNETGVIVERSTNGVTWKPIAKLGANVTSYSDTEIGCEQTYWYRVYAVNTIYALHSDFTAAINALCLGTPTSLQITNVGSASVSLAWNDLASETAYHVERSDNAGVNWAEIDTTAANVTVYTDDGLTCSTAYLYRVRATDGVNFSDYSNIVSTTTAPCTPTLSLGTVSATSVELSWTDVLTETQYRIERSPDSTNWTEIAQPAQNATSYTDTTVVCEGHYVYRIRAYRSSDGLFSQYSDTVTVDMPLCALTAPTGLSATNITTTTITLQWSENNTSDTAHLLERRDDGVNWIQIAELGATSTGYVNSGLTCETTYEYRVRVYRSTDDAYSAYSNTIGPTTALCPLPKNPTDLQATATNPRSVDLTWVDHNLGVMRYTVERSLDGGTSWQTYPQLANDVTAFNAYNLTCQHEYRFRVRGVRGVDNLLTNYSDSITVQTSACPTLTTPNAPTVSSFDRTFVSLAFTADSSGEVTSWQLERFTAGNWQTLVTLPVATTQYTDNNLICGTAYAYRLRSYRAEDNTYSAYSSETPVTTPDCPTAFQSTVGLYKNGVWQFTALNSGIPDITFRFGPNEAGWTPLVGDWDGDGVDGIGVYRNGFFILRNASNAGVSDATFYFGAREAGWQPVVGDWNGDGVDTVGLYKAGLVILTNNHATLSVDYRLRLGDGTADWLILAGDWDGSGADSLGLYRGGYFYLTNNLDGSGLRRPFQFGPTQTGWLPLVGDWDAQSGDSIGVYRQSIWRLRNSNSTGGSDIGFNFGAREAGWIPLASYRGGAAPLLVMASAANIAIPAEAVPTLPPTEPPVVATTETFTETVASLTLTPEPTLEPSPEITVEPTVIIEPTIETSATPIPVEVTDEPQVESTETVSEP